MHTRARFATILSYAAVAVCFFLFAATLGAQITPSADSYTSSTASKTNYGAAATLAVDGATDIAYIQFNLASIPAGASVEKATLKLYVNAVTTAGSFNIDYVNGAWTESTITHNLAPALGATIASGVALTTASKNDYILIDITPAVQAWLEGTQANDGIALVANSTFNASFDSKESTTTSHPAELDIVFAGGTGTITGVETNAGSGLTGGGTSGTLNLSLTTACAAGQVLEWTGSAWACASAGGTGTITGVTAGTGLSGGGTSGNVPLSVNESVVAFQTDLTNGVNTAEGFATTAATTAQNTAEAYSNSAFVPLAGGTMTGALNIAGASGTGLSIGGNLFDFGSYANTSAYLGFAGNTTNTGYANTAAGTQAMVADTTGWGNSAFGTTALFNNTTGNGNIAMGGLSLYTNQTGSWNTATGGRALYNATSNYNTANGHDALFSTNSGGNNTAVGGEAMFANTTGSNNTALGYHAAYDQTVLTNATAIGANSDVTENNAVVLGSVAGVNGATTSVNVGIGTTAPQFTLDVQGTGNFSGPVTFGSPVTFAAGQTFPGSGSGSISGVTAGTGLTGGGTSGNVTLNVNQGVVAFQSDLTNGINALQTFATTAATTAQNTAEAYGNSTFVPLAGGTMTGTLNIAGAPGTGLSMGGLLFDSANLTTFSAFLGFAGNTSSTGVEDTAIGYQALASNTIGYNVTAGGYQALFSNTSGSGNTAFGTSALFSNQTGSSNVALGGHTLYSNVAGMLNTAVGGYALYNSTGPANTAVGRDSLYLMTAGGYNTGVGYQALYNNQTGGYNTALGYQAGPDTSPASNALTNATAIGANAVVSQSNALILGCVSGVNNCQGPVSVGIGTATPAYTLDVQGSARFTQPVVFASGQTFPGSGSGSITGVTAGAGLTGGGTSGNVTLALDTTKVVTGVGLTAPSTDFIVTGSPVTGNGTLGLGWITAPDFNNTANAIVKRDGSGNFSAGAINAATSFNLGGNVFDQANYASTSAFLGFAGNSTMTGYANTGVGYQALLADTTGYANTAVGSTALSNNTTGWGNSAIGDEALLNNTTGYANIAIGGLALSSNTTGIANTATGGLTLRYATSSDNTADGDAALSQTTTGGGNTAVGTSALLYNTTGANNTALGYQAAYDHAYTTLMNATAIGAFSDVTQNNSLVLGCTPAMNANCPGAVSVGIGTSAPQFTLDVQGTANFTGLVNFSSSQTFPGIAALASANTFTGNQTVNGNVSATGVVTGSGYQIGSNLFAFGSVTNYNAFLGFAGNTTMTGTQNTASGFQALAADTTGWEDTATGYLALADNTTGQENTATGTIALASNTTGNQNTATGGWALQQNTTGSGNTATGTNALIGNTLGSNNTATGLSALDSNSTGSENTATGAVTMLDNTTGSSNTAEGFWALFHNTTGFNNTASGVQALFNNTTGNSNTALGYQAGPDANSTGLSNATAIGANAVVSENNALVLGCVSGVNNCLGPVSVGIGTATPAYSLDVHGSANFTGAVNFASPVTFASGQTFPGAGGSGTITGVTAGTGLSGGGTSGTVTLNNTGILSVAAGTGITSSGGQTPTIAINTAILPQLSAANTFTGNQTVSGNLSATGVVTGSSFQIGSNLFASGNYSLQEALLGFAGNTTMTGDGNTGVGVQALYSNTAGGYNTAVGGLALYSNTAGPSNTAMGFTALSSNTSGGDNSGFGSQALISNLTGSYNTAAGAASLYSNTTGAYNTASGAEALEYNTTGSNNTASGMGALLNNTTGFSNTASGESALLSNTTGIDNTASGVGALAYNNTGNNNTAVGAGALGLESDTNGVELTCIGYSCGAAYGLVNATAIGAYAYVGESNALVLGSINGVSGATSNTNVGIGTIAPSYIFQIAKGLGSAYADGWATYSSRRWKTNIHTLHDALHTIEQLRGVSYDLRDSGKHEIGVIAEEVGAVVPEVVSYEKNGKDAAGVDYGRLTALLIEATKEQQKLIQQQEEQIQTQQAQLKVQQARIDQLSRQVREVQAAVKKNRQDNSAIHTVRTESVLHQ